MPVLFCGRAKGVRLAQKRVKDARSLSSLRLTFIDDTKLKRVLLGFAAQQIASEVKGLSAGVPWKIPWEIPSAYASADGGLARHEP
jgi:hypothetical protein